MGTLGGAFGKRRKSEYLFSDFPILRFSYDPQIHEPVDLPDQSSFQFYCCFCVQSTSYTSNSSSDFLYYLHPSRTTESKVSFFLPQIAQDFTRTEVALFSMDVLPYKLQSNRTVEHEHTMHYRRLKTQKSVLE